MESRCGVDEGGGKVVMRKEALVVVVASRVGAREAEKVTALWRVDEVAM